MNTGVASVYFGSWIGAALDSADWNGGTQVVSDVLLYGWDTWFDLSELTDATVLVNKTGMTDISVRDITVAGTTNYNFETSKVKTQIRVTYTLPSTRLLAVTGVGVAGWFHKHFGFLHKKRMIVFDPLRTLGGHNATATLE